MHGTNKKGEVLPELICNPEAGSSLILKDGRCRGESRWEGKQVRNTGLSVTAEMLRSGAGTPPLSDTQHMPDCLVLLWDGAIYPFQYIQLQKCATPSSFYIPFLET